MGDTSSHPLPPVPDAWTKAGPSLAGKWHLNVAGFESEYQVTQPLLQNVLFPLLALLVGHAQHGRVLAGVAGIPGIGKTTFSALCQSLADILIEPGYLAVVSADGWHLPNATLDIRTTTSPAGETVSLRKRKGAPETFDVNAMVQTLAAIQAAERAVSFPVYDRNQHEPIEAGGTLSLRTRVVLVEGNYVLSRSDEWSQVSRMLMPRILLAGDLDVVRKRLQNRHMRGGATPAEAVEKFESNDRLNAENVFETRGEPDIIIDLSAESIQCLNPDLSIRALP